MQAHYDDDFTKMNGNYFLLKEYQISSSKIFYIQIRNICQYMTAKFNNFLRDRNTVPSCVEYYKLNLYTGQHFV